MKKKLLVCILALALVVSSLPIVAFAGEDASSNKLVVTYDNELNYLNLGDSVAAGYGLGDYAPYGVGSFYNYALSTEENPYYSNVMQIWMLPYAISGGYDNSPAESYSSVVKTRLNSLVKSGTNVNLYQRALCVARAQDICTLIDGQKYKGDDYFNELVRFMLRGTLDWETSGEKKPSIESAWGTEGYIPYFPNDGYPSLKALNDEYSKRVKDADLISITVGGNNLYSYVTFSAMENWYVNSEGKTSKTYKEGYEKALKTDLSDWYDESFVKKYNLIKTAAIAEAKLVDYIKSLKASKSTAELSSEGASNEQLQQLAAFLKIDLSSTESTVRSMFNYFEIFAYTVAALKQSVPQTLDLIHEMNPAAKVALTSVPCPFADYSVQISDKFKLNVGSIMSPIITLVNKTISNAASERSEYVRYIESQNVDLLEPYYSSTENGQLTKTFPDKNLTVQEFFVLLTGTLEASHPSAKGHAQIAEEIMKNFTFECNKEDTPTTVWDYIGSILKKIVKGDMSFFSDIFDRIKNFKVFDIFNKIFS